MHKQAFILHTESHTKAWHIYKKQYLQRNRIHLKHTIMEKQITLEQAGTACGKINSMIKKATSMLNAPLRLLGRYYSYVIERNLDMRQTKAITEAQMAFFATILPVEMPILLHLAACMWFIMSLKKCRSLLK